MNNYNNCTKKKSILTFQTVTFGMFFLIVYIKMIFLTANYPNKYYRPT